MIDFWASWCAPCRKTNKKLVKLYKEYGGNDFEVVGISSSKHFQVLLADDPGTFDLSQTVNRTTSLPKFARKTYDGTYYIYRSQEIQKYVPDLIIVENNFKQDFDQRNYMVSNAKLESKGWKPEFSLEDGIQELIMGYQLIRKFKDKDFTNL